MDQAIQKLFKETERLLTERYGGDVSPTACFAGGKNTISLCGKKLYRQIDEEWVDVIEKTLPNIDAVVRNPRKDIAEREEVMPIELSRNITPASLRHLAQHTDYIKEYDEKTGIITPSRVLNVFKEENFNTYENRFVNTLIDRLFLFVERRYAELKGVAASTDSSVLSILSDAKLNDADVRITVKIERTSRDAGMGELPEDRPWERIAALRAAVLQYKECSFAKMMEGKTIRPPVMRTNAIVQNVDLRQCLILWQYIESYDKLGYEIRASEQAVKPDEDYINCLYTLLALQYAVFDGAKEGEAINKRGTAKPVKPRILKSFSGELLDNYDVYDTEYIKQLRYNPVQGKRRLSGDEADIKSSINAAINFEKQKQKRLEAQARQKEKELDKKQRESERKEAQKLALIKEKQRGKAERKQTSGKLEAGKRQKQPRVKKTGSGFDSASLVNAGEERALLTAQQPKVKVNKAANIDNFSIAKEPATEQSVKEQARAPEVSGYKPREKYRYTGELLKSLRGQAELEPNIRPEAQELGVDIKEAEFYDISGGGDNAEE